ncbi:MAG: SGNH/GDSL hydrolase family protein [Bacteroidota bacterium]
MRLLSILLLCFILPYTASSQIRDHQLKPALAGQFRGTDTAGVSTSFFPEILPKGLDAYAANQLVQVSGALYKNVSGDTLRSSPPGSGWENITALRQFTSDKLALYSEQSGLQNPLLPFSDSIRRDSIVTILMSGDSRTGLDPVPSALARNLSQNYGWKGCGFQLASEDNFNEEYSFNFFTLSSGGGTEASRDDDFQSNPSTTFSSRLSTNGLARSFFTNRTLGVNSVPTDSLSFYTNVRVYYRKPEEPATLRFQVDGINFDKGLETSTADDVGFVEVEGLAYGPHNLNLIATQGNFAAFEIVFTNDYQQGILLLAGGNVGIEPEVQQLLMPNTYFYQDYRPDVSIIRHGVNGFVNEDVEGTFDAVKVIVDTIANYSNGIILVGEPDNDLTDVRGEQDVTEFNYMLDTFAAARNYVFVDLHNYLPNWTAFTSLGFARDIIHESVLGGFQIAKYILHAVDNYQQGVEGNVINYVKDELANVSTSLPGGVVSPGQYDYASVTVADNGLVTAISANPTPLQGLGTDDNYAVWNNGQLTDGDLQRITESGEDFTSSSVNMLYDQKPQISKVNSNLYAIDNAAGQNFGTSVDAGGLIIRIPRTEGGVYANIELDIYQYNTAALKVTLSLRLSGTFSGVDKALLLPNKGNNDAFNNAETVSFSQDATHKIIMLGDSTSRWERTKINVSKIIVDCSNAAQAKAIADGIGFEITTTYDSPSFTKNTYFLVREDGNVYLDEDDLNFETEGNIGIGLNLLESPTAKLDIQGNLRIRNIPIGTPAGNLGFDVNGNVVRGTTGSEGLQNPLTEDLETASFNIKSSGSSTVDITLRDDEIDVAGITVSEQALELPTVTGSQTKTDALYWKDVVINDMAKKRLHGRVLEDAPSPRSGGLATFEEYRYVTDQEYLEDRNFKLGNSQIATDDPAITLSNLSFTSIEAGTYEATFYLRTSKNAAGSNIRLDLSISASGFNSANSYWTVKNGEYSPTYEMADTHTGSTYPASTNEYTTVVKVFFESTGNGSIDIVADPELNSGNLDLFNFLSFSYSTLKKLK